MTFVNQVTIPETVIDAISSGQWQPRDAVALGHVDDSAQSLPQILSASEIASMQTAIAALDWQPVGVTGIVSEYQPGDPVGSWRASLYSQQLAEALWRRVSAYLPDTRSFDQQARTDWDNHPVWRPIGINPLLRLIRYRNSGLLVPHYDAPYVASGIVRTLTTVVIYLACDADVIGGETRFIADPQQHLDHDQRDYADWTRVAQEEEIIAAVDPLPGSALIFDHRILHDSAPLAAQKGSKIILRTDVLYERA